MPSAPEFSRVPSRYSLTTLADYDPKVSDSAGKAHAAAVAYLEARRSEREDDDAQPGPSNVVLVGPPGVGKTHLSAAVFTAERDLIQASESAALAAYEAEDVEYRRKAAEWWALPQEEKERRMAEGAKPINPPRYPMPGQSARPRWVNVPSVLVDIRREFGSDDKPITDALHRLRTHEATVVLDDLGREKVSDWTAEVLYVLVNDRYEEHLPTIVTTNLERSELVSSGYWPVISRLAEDGILVEVKAPDQRLRRRTA